MLSRAVPQLPVLKQLAFALRRAGRSMVRDPVDVRHWRLRLRLHTSGNISESTFLFMPGRWDRRERSFLARHLHAGSVFVDVGSNAGGYLWWVQRKLGSSWRGVAVEPDPALRARLEQNLRANGMSHVELFPVAVGPAAGTAELVVNPRNRGQNVLATPGGHSDSDASEKVEVPVVPLPELLHGAGVDRVDALKIDVEGLEPAILQDFLARAPDTLLPRLILTELSDSEEHRGLLASLEEAGYRIELRTRLNAGLVRMPPAD